MAHVYVYSHVSLWFWSVIPILPTMGKEIADGGYSLLARVGQTAWPVANGLTRLHS